MYGDHAPNSELLSAIAGKKTGEALIRRYTSLTALANASFQELQEVDGVGQSKAAAIRAAFILANRLAREAHRQGSVMDTPERVADLLRDSFRQLVVETLHVLLVNTRHRLLDVIFIAQGTLDTLLVHPREVFHPAIVRRAASIILVHNHPSGDPSPSEADIRVTRELIKAGSILKIPVVDHIIMGQRTEDRLKDFASLRELGYFY